MSESAGHFLIGLALLTYARLCMYVGPGRTVDKVFSILFGLLAGAFFVMAIVETAS